MRRAYGIRSALTLCLLATAGGCIGGALSDDNNDPAGGDGTNDTSGSVIGSGPVSGVIGAIGGKCVDIPNGVNTNGTQVQLWDCNGATAQKWTFERDGSVHILGKCLDVPGNTTAAGTKVQLWDCNGLPFQKWITSPDGVLYNPNSGKCLDVPNAIIDNGTKLQIWYCNQAPAQTFAPPHAASGSQSIIGPGFKCLDVQGIKDRAASNGNKVGIFDCLENPWQRFTLTPDGAIHVLDKCLDVPAPSTASGTKLQVWDCNGSVWQKWVPRADGSLFNPNSGKCLDVPNGITTNGTQVQLWDCNGLGAQRWSVPLVAGDVTVTVDAGAPGAAVTREMYGYILEDISRSVEGGLYGELLRNRSLKEENAHDLPGVAMPGWSSLNASGGSGNIALDRGVGLNSAVNRSLRLDVGNAGPDARVGAANGGYFGVPVRPSTHYTTSFWARGTAGLTGPLTVSLESLNGTRYASATVTGVGTGWKRFEAALDTNGSAPTTGDARFVVSVGGCGGACASVNGQSLWLSVVSLFPPTFKGRANGLRSDLAGLLEAGRPGLFRVPGGNYLEGAVFETRFKWKETIGPVEQRPGHMDDAWGYWSTDGMGLLEYLELAEDTGSQPLLAIYAGYSLKGQHVPQGELGPYIQEALDEIEYAIGPTTSTWGARRAADGHPAPFDVRYVEIGNEDWFDGSGSYDGFRFPMFYDAIRAKYPQLKLVATAEVHSRKPDVIDEHYYPRPNWFADNAHRYDLNTPDAPKVLIGEYGAAVGNPTPTWESGLNEAAFLTGTERNAASVIGSMYAPILVNERNVNWGTNMIGFDVTRAYGSPSYWVVRTFAENLGDHVVPARSLGGPEVYVSATSAGNKVFLKLVNTSPVARATTVNLTGIASVSGPVKLTRITAGLNDRNALDAPSRVAPKTEQVNGSGSSLQTKLAPSSVTVLAIDVKR